MVGYLRSCIAEHSFYLDIFMMPLPKIVTSCLELISNTQSANPIFIFLHSILILFIPLLILKVFSRVLHWDVWPIFQLIISVTWEETRLSVENPGMPGGNTPSFSAMDSRIQ